jgi:hypothetical protein
MSALKTHVRSVEDPMDVTLNATGDGSTNDATKLTAAFTEAAGRAVSVPLGGYSLSAGMTLTTPIVLRGVNASPGPGPAAQFHAYDSEIYGAYNNDYDIDVTIQYGSVVEDIKFNTQVANRPMTSGGAIAMKGPTGVNQSGTKIRNNAFTNKYNSAYFLLPAYPQMTGNYHDNVVNAAAVYETESTDEGAGGWFSQEYVFGTSGSLTGAGVISRVGYIHINDNMLIGQAYGVDLSVRDYPAGSVRIINTNMENQGIGAVRARTVDGEDASMFLWQGNEFSNIDYADSDYLADYLIESYGSVWLDTVSITNNVHRNLWTNATASYYDIRSGTNVLIANNVVTHISGSNAGVKVLKVGAQVDNAYVTGFVFDQSVHTTPYDLTAEVTLLDINNRLTVAQLPTAQDLSVVGIIDTSIRSLVWRQNSTWSRLNEYAIATVATDVDFTLTPLKSNQNIQHTGTLTADRTITLSSTGVGLGTMFHITRTGGGAFNLSVGGLKNLVQNTWCIVAWNGSAYVLRAYGAL